MLMRRTPRPSSPLSSLKNIVTNPRKKRFPIHHKTLARNPPPHTQPKHEKGDSPLFERVNPRPLTLALLHATDSDLQARIHSEIRCLTAAQVTLSLAAIPA